MSAVLIAFNFIFLNFIIVLICELALIPALITFFGLLIFLLVKDKNVKSILINIFGGIVRCDRVANGVVQAVNELNLNVPVIVRLEGTNAKEAKQILLDSNVSILPANSIQDAANKAVNKALNI